MIDDETSILTGKSGNKEYYTGMKVAATRPFVAAEGASTIELKNNTTPKLCGASWADRKGGLGHRVTGCADVAIEIPVKPEPKPTKPVTPTEPTGANAMAASVLAVAAAFALNL